MNRNYWRRIGIFIAGAITGSVLLLHSWHPESEEHALGKRLSIATKSRERPLSNNWYPAGVFRALQETQNPEEALDLAKRIVADADDGQCIAMINGFEDDKDCLNLLVAFFTKTASIDRKRPRFIPPPAGRRVVC